MQTIGSVRSPYREGREIPKGLGVKHEAEGVIEIRPEFEPGLTDIEGFSHLFIGKLPSKTAMAADKRRLTPMTNS